MSEKCEKYFQTEVCLRILEEDINDARLNSLIKRRLTNQGLIKHGSLSSGGIIEGLILDNKMEEACLKVIETI